MKPQVHKFDSIYRNFWWHPVTDQFYYMETNFVSFLQLRALSDHRASEISSSNSIKSHRMTNWRKQFYIINMQINSSRTTYFKSSWYYCDKTTETPLLKSRQCIFSKNVTFFSVLLNKKKLSYRMKIEFRFLQFILVFKKPTSLT